MSDLNKQHNELTDMMNTRVSRRSLLGIAGQGALGIALAALLGGKAANAAPRTTLERMLPGAKELSARPTPAGGSAVRSLLTSIALPSNITLPQWGDGMKFNQPEYYETLCAGDVDGDGQDELIVRGPKGVLVQRFDPGSGQWLPLPGESLFFGDASGWNDPKYYQTIQCTDVDGDGQAEIVARGKDGMIAYRYDTSTKKFTALPTGDFFGDIHDNGIWMQEAHYSTIKWGKAKAPGYGLQWVVGRNTSGIIAHYYAAEIPGWFLPTFTVNQWPDNDSDGTNWTLPQYYETIQFADVDGDGQEELVGRAASGLRVLKYSDTNHQWTQIYGNGGIMADAAGWDRPEYYSTIRCADIDGDGKKEILVRGATGIIAYHYDTDASGNATFYAMSVVNSPNFVDASNGIWTSPECYSTIHFGDIDGDGSEELIARDWGGITTWKYFSYGPHAGEWMHIAGATSNIRNPGWTDDGTDGNGNAVADSNGTKWDQVEYYSTIRLVRTHPDTRTYLANPHCSPTYDGSGGARQGPYATLIGRDMYGVQTWRYQQSTNTREDGGSWVATAAPMPDFTSTNADADYLNGYAYLTSYWGLSNGDLRNNYNNTDWGDSDFQDKKSALFSPAPGNYYQTPIPTPSLAKPANVSDAGKWQAMCWQLYWEMVHVQHVRHLFEVDIASLIIDLETTDQATLNAVIDYLSIPATSDASLGISLPALFGNMLWAILGMDGLGMATEAGLCGIMGTAFGEMTLFSDSGGGGSFYGTIAQLQTALTDNYTNAKIQNASIEYNIIGGNVVVNNNTVYNDGHWGPLFAFGQMIASGALVYPEKQEIVNNQVVIVPDNVAMTQASQPYKALKYWQSLILASNWMLGYNSGYNAQKLPTGYPSQYTIIEQEPNPDNPHNAPDAETIFISVGDVHFDSYPDPASLSALFDGSNRNLNFPFPMAVPLNDVFLGQSGWPTLDMKNWGHRDDGGDDGIVRKAVPVPLKATIELTPTLSRSEDGNGYIVALSLRNRGMTSATNVEIISTTIGNVQPMAPLYGKRTRLAQEEEIILHARFSTRAGQSGQTVVLRVQGRYKGGTFGGSFRVKLP